MEEDSAPIPVTIAFTGAGVPVDYVPTKAESRAQCGEDHPYHPFASSQHYQWGENAIRGKLSATVINGFLKADCGLKDDFKTHLPSSYSLFKAVDEMITSKGLGANSWQKSKLRMHFELTTDSENVTFWYRDVVKCV